MTCVHGKKYSQLTQVFAFCSFLPMVNQSENTKWGFPGLKQFMKIKMHAILITMMRFLSVELCMLPSYSLRSISLITSAEWYHSTCVQVTILFNNSPKAKSSDSGKLDTIPKRSCKVLSLSENVKLFHRHTDVRKTYSIWFGVLSVSW
jgi:hypothetical protein